MEYDVKRAIFLAAGRGERLMPLTENTPKPLVRVNGKRIIDSAIEACLKVGIEKIYVVIGYKAQQFNELRADYPMIKLVYNPYWEQANNIGSVYVVKNLLENALVLEADLLILNPDVILPSYYASNCLGAKVYKTSDWCFETKDNSLIIKHSLGGTDCYHEYGITFLDEHEGKQFSKDLVWLWHRLDINGQPLNLKEYGLNVNNVEQLFWEQALLTLREGRHQIVVRECRINDIYEIDTVKDLEYISQLPPPNAFGV